MTRVLVAAASSVVRAGLQAIVNAEPTFEVVGTESNLSALADGTDATQPDVVLVALERGEDSTPALPLGARAGLPGLVLLADDPEGVEAAEALRHGARAVLPREAQAEEIVAAIGGVATGLVVLHPDLASGLIPHLVPVAHPLRASEVETLTPREIEVLGMLAEGAGNKSIARRLGISEHTVKFHVGSILGKLGASSRTEAVTLGVRQGLILL
jgi:two-component system, NarL family, response regulator YdfI